jgi:hypothetical protein
MQKTKSLAGEQTLVWVTGYDLEEVNVTSATIVLSFFSFLSSIKSRQKLETMIQRWSDTQSYKVLDLNPNHFLT